ncbi:hypothetical protein E2C01_088556 [Portunus trituberculatus]|uniref:Uncharacterized protein n=1 Tax=Portunus trituberculatus TaxID=210409 RepID=A0A5B7J9L3_PORTR|nr:hypothetical protein [Portunus trituberculatus]
MQLQETTQRRKACETTEHGLQDLILQAHHHFPATAMATQSARRLLSNTVENLTVKFFPGISFSHLSGNSYGSEAVASLPLQMVLYFSTLFFPCWLGASVIMMAAKVRQCLNLILINVTSVHFRKKKIKCLIQNKENKGGKRIIK